MATKIIRFDFTADANSVAYNSGTIGNGDYTTVDDNPDSIGMWDKVIYNGRRIVKKYNENQILRLPSHTVFEGGAWTVGFRFKHSDNISRNYLLYNYLDDIVNDMQYGFFIEVRSDIIQVTIGVGSAGNRLNIPFVCDEVSLYELAISYDPATKEATFTMNGIVLGTDTHTGVAHTMQGMMRNSRFQEFIDGYVYIIFNKKFIDNTMVFSKFGGSYMEDALILTVKKKGKAQTSYSNLANNFISKIKKYVPKEAKKLWENYKEI